MTLKEMFKKIKAYNEIAEIIGGEKLGIKLNDRDKDCRVCLFTAKCEDYKTLRKALLDEYIETAANEILNYGEYEFDRDFEIGESIIEIRVCEI